MNSVLKKEIPNLAVLSNEELKNIDGGVVPLAIAGVAGFTKVAGAITAGAGVVGAGYVGGKWVGKKIFK
ncbi:class IIb bacteriocin, lactobin A/cerein 7B family [Bacillus cereus]|uniref:class IIb bacteriocin, lactobin A/cerein 7B family n=1 Tax=Bacillus cereus group TaxID=86661 RepID=UPI001F57BC0F|nr:MULTISPECIES: class IIb bacteriocin, lactobin A/cerein 7B family [Bacillus cereus group]MDF9610950.1 class IIb bacteriocin, lactobin A/cerein 7B family [Bacillus cereus]